MTHDMKLRERMPATPARQAALVFGGLCVLSCISLLSEGTGHLRIFLPLAAVNLLVGVWASERVARVFLLLEGGLLFGWVGSQLLGVHERHVH